jgi:F-type H+-transporting ATPase subunit a|tara:strand:+ start:2238 stop:3044 length:807 start_codon:yes stop_codon:yes gene_type:complete
VAGSYETPSEYIGHHLQNNTISFGDSPFWTIHLDTIVMSVLLGVLSMGLIWLVARKATAGVPNKSQVFVELLFGFIDDQVKTSFHGNRHAFIAPAALTVFVWVLLMNTMDLLPIDIMAKIYGIFHIEYWKNVPTTDINTTFALALGVWFLMIFFGIKVHGLKGWLRDLFCAPFGSNPFLWPLNFLFNLIEYISKPLSHSLRLYGNLYAGELVFLLIGMLAGFSGILGAISSTLLGAGWAIFHILIVTLQAFVFMMLTVVYLSMAHEGH